MVRCPARGRPAPAISAPVLPGDRRARQLHRRGAGAADGSARADRRDPLAGEGAGDHAISPHLARRVADGDGERAGDPRARPLAAGQRAATRHLGSGGHAEGALRDRLPEEPRRVLLAGLRAAFSAGASRDRALALERQLARRDERGGAPRGRRRGRRQSRGTPGLRDRPALLRSGGAARARLAGEDRRGRKELSADLRAGAAPAPPELELHHDAERQCGGPRPPRSPPTSPAPGRSSATKEVMERDRQRELGARSRTTSRSIAVRYPPPRTSRAPKRGDRRPVSG